MDEKLIKVIRRSVGLLDDVIDVLRVSVSCQERLHVMHNSDRKHTVTAELTKSAKKNATFLMLDGRARLSRGPHASTYQLQSVS